MKIKWPKKMMISSEMKRNFKKITALSLSLVLCFLSVPVSAPLSYAAHPIAPGEHYDYHAGIPEKDIDVDKNPTKNQDHAPSIPFHENDTPLSPATRSEGEEDTHQGDGSDKNQGSAAADALTHNSDRLNEHQEGLAAQFRTRIEELQRNIEHLRQTYERILEGLQTRIQELRQNFSQILQKIQEHGTGAPHGNIKLDKPVEGHETQDENREPPASLHQILEGTEKRQDKIAAQTEEKIAHQPEVSSEHAVAAFHAAEKRQSEQLNEKAEHLGEVLTKIGEKNSSEETPAIPNALPLPEKDQNSWQETFSKTFLRYEAPQPSPAPIEDAAKEHLPARGLHELAEHRISEQIDKVGSQTEKKEIQHTDQPHVLDVIREIETRHTEKLNKKKDHIEDILVRMAGHKAEDGGESPIIADDHTATHQPKQNSWWKTFSETFLRHETPQPVSAPELHAVSVEDSHSSNVADAEAAKHENTLPENRVSYQYQEPHREPRRNFELSVRGEINKTGENPEAPSASEETPAIRSEMPEQARAVYVAPIIADSVNWDLFRLDPENPEKPFDWKSMVVDYSNARNNFIGDAGVSATVTTQTQPSLGETPSAPVVRGNPPTPQNPSQGEAMPPASSGPDLIPAPNVEPNEGGNKKDPKPTEPSTPTPPPFVTRGHEAWTKAPSNPNFAYRFTRIETFLVSSRVYQAVLEVKDLRSGKIYEVALFESYASNEHEPILEAQQLADIIGSPEGNKEVAIYGVMQEDGTWKTVLTRVINTQEKLELSGAPVSVTVKGNIAVVKTETGTFRVNLDTLTLVPSSLSSFTLTDGSIIEFNRSPIPQTREDLERTYKDLTAKVTRPNGEVTYYEDVITMYHFRQCNEADPWAESCLQSHGDINLPLRLVQMPNGKKHYVVVHKGIGGFSVSRGDTPIAWLHDGKGPGSWVVAMQFWGIPVDGGSKPRSIDPSMDSVVGVCVIGVDSPCNGPDANKTEPPRIDLSGDYLVPSSQLSITRDGPNQDTDVERDTNVNVVAKLVLSTQDNSVIVSQLYECSSSGCSASPVALPAGMDLYSFITGHAGQRSFVGDITGHQYFALPLDKSYWLYTALGIQATHRYNTPAIVDIRDGISTKVHTIYLVLVPPGVGVAVPVGPGEGGGSNPVGGPAVPPTRPPFPSTPPPDSGDEDNPARPPFPGEVPPPDQGPGNPQIPSVPPPDPESPPDNGQGGNPAVPPLLRRTYEMTPTSSVDASSSIVTPEVVTVDAPEYPQDNAVPQAVVESERVPPLSESSESRENQGDWGGLPAGWMSDDGNYAIPEGLEKSLQQPVIDYYKNRGQQEEMESYKVTSAQPIEGLDGGGNVLDARYVTIEVFLTDGSTETLFATALLRSGMWIVTLSPLMSDVLTPIL